MRSMRYAPQSRGRRFYPMRQWGSNPKRPRGWCSCGLFSSIIWSIGTSCPGPSHNSLVRVKATSHLRETHETFYNLKAFSRDSLVAGKNLTRSLDVKIPWSKPLARSLIDKNSISSDFFVVILARLIRCEYVHPIGARYCSFSTQVILNCHIRQKSWVTRGICYETRIVWQPP